MAPDLVVGRRVVVGDDRGDRGGAVVERQPRERERRRGARPPHVREDRDAPAGRLDRRPDDPGELVVGEQRALARGAARHQRVDAGFDQEVDVRAQGAGVGGPAVVVGGEQGDDDGGPGQFHVPEASGRVDHTAASGGATSSRR